jgi:hypothetical protein
MLKMVLDEDELQRLYMDECWPVIRIAEKFQCSTGVIYNHLDSLGITRKPGELKHQTVALSLGDVYHERKIIECIDKSTSKYRYWYLVQCLQCQATQTLRAVCILKYGCPSCSQEHRNLDYPNPPYRFRSLLDTTRCGWVRCPDPMLAPVFDKNSGSAGHVDHNRRCPFGHDPKKACKHCIRSYVHRNCNLIIVKWDWALDQSELVSSIPADVAKYLALGSSVEG